MKRTMILTVVLALSLFSMAAVAGDAVEGTLVDGKCFLKMGAKGNDHGEMAGCGTACAKMGIPTGVVTADGNYYTLVVASSVVAKHVGSTVRVTGMKKDGNLIAEAIEVKTDSGWKKVKLASMM